MRRFSSSGDRQPRFELFLDQFRLAAARHVKSFRQIGAIDGTGKVSHSSEIRSSDSRVEIVRKKFRDIFRRRQPGLWQTRLTRLR